MSEDAPVNTGAVRWPDPVRGRVDGYGDAGQDCTAGRARILSRWFGDLFNLVYDPAFLVVALAARVCQ